MPIRFECPQCLSRLTISRKFAGKRGRCPQCKNRIQVPEIEITDPLAEDSWVNPQPMDPALIENKPSEGIQGTAIMPATPAVTKDAQFFTDKVPIPRWAVYLQGALLGVIATTFFIFGLAVGNNTAPVPAGEASKDSVIAGAVYFDSGRERMADFGAVVIFLPVDSAPRERPDAAGLRPDRFQAVRNPAIDAIRGMGGAVVRTDRDGKFELELAAQTTYWWLVISRNKSVKETDISKQTRAELGAWFLPIEDLLGEQDFAWNKIRVSGSRVSMQTITF
ncbi:MAG: hypothetical protein P8J33_11445 [Pirellulaceae bacterium]|nr:hypothetical protein [Pirellulaceae bacterium]